jgi:hypothetical protein
MREICNDRLTWLAVLLRKDDIGLPLRVCK